MKFETSSTISPTLTTTHLAKEYNELRLKVATRQMTLNQAKKELRTVLHQEFSEAQGLTSGLSGTIAPKPRLRLGK